MEMMPDERGMNEAYLGVKEEPFRLFLLEA